MEQVAVVYNVTMDRVIMHIVILVFLKCHPGAINGFRSKGRAWPGDQQCWHSATAGQKGTSVITHLVGSVMLDVLT